MGRAGRELQVQLLLDRVHPIVVALSKTEVPVDDGNVVFKNYTVFYPAPVPNKGHRLLLLVRDDIAARCVPNVIKSSTMEIWLKLATPRGPIVVASVYRQWTGAAEEEDLQKLHESFREFTSSFDRVLVMGDMNLDLARINDPDYYRRRLLLLHLTCLEECGLTIANAGEPTYFSHGSFNDGTGAVARRSSVLDHVYHVGLSSPLPSFTVLQDAITDHRPTLLGLDLGQRGAGLKMISRRNFKSINSSICWAINAEALSRVFFLDDVEEVHGVIVEEIAAALDLVAPLQQVQVKERSTPLYLSADTLSLMKSRDAAAASGDHNKYRRLRNKTAKLVRRDKLDSNVRHLQAKEFNPKAVWQLANSASGRSQKSALPTELYDESTDRGIAGEDRLADFVNKFYIDKIDKIRAGIEGRKRGAQSAQLQPDRGQQQQRQQQQQQQQQRVQQRQRFQFRPPLEGEIRSIIMGLNNTGALGVDGIPVAVLKILAPIIAAPMSHLIGRSFAQAAVPSGFKKASVLPLHKKHKPTNLPSSYRPVAILPALSKIMERAVLRQVSPHLAAQLPPEQFGFRPRRSTSAAIAYAHGSWSAARARGLEVVMAGYDLSSAFDTIDVRMVCSKLKRFGVEGGENAWFHDYLMGRQQQVHYNGSRSTFRPVLYGVPQGSILGPLLFLVLVADLPARIRCAASSHLEVGCSAYADDVLCWVAGKSAVEVGREMEHLSDVIVSYASENYLALNESKTQVLWCSKRGAPMRVGESMVTPTDKIEVLGVSFDRSLSPLPYVTALISATRALTAIARRLSLHLPVEVLKSVMSSLYKGKIGYASLVLKPRLKVSDSTSSAMAQLQVCANDLARAIIGSNRNDRLRVEDILKEAGFEPINKMIVYTIAMECWRALTIRDVPDGPLNPLGAILSLPAHPSSSARTRAATNGCLPPPTRLQSDPYLLEFVAPAQVSHNRDRGQKGRKVAGRGSSLLI